MVWLDRLFGGKFPIGISLVVITGIIAVAIACSLAFPKLARQSAIQPCHIWIVMRLSGVACLLLSVSSLLFAAGPAHKFIPLAALAQVPAELLYQSAICYALCGTLLIGASATQRKS